jgi:hypothetical protein
VKPTRILLLLTALCVTACSRDERPEQAGSEPQRPATVVDSIFPMPVMIERFQAGMPRRPAELGVGSTSSRDSLISQFVRAVEQGNATALRALRLDAAEFAFLYFPESRLSRPPLQQPPEISWMLVEQNGVKGETRVLQVHGGRPLHYRGYTCEAEPTIEGSLRLWDDCRLLLGEQRSPARLFGSIVERDGRFKFVSIANDL